MSSFLAEARIPFVELLHFSMRSPMVVAAACVTKMEIARALNASRQVIPRGQLVGEALVLKEAVLTRRIDSLLVETQGVRVPLFDARDLRQHQCVLVGERRR